jgi:hypothetical protein
LANKKKSKKRKSGERGLSGETKDQYKREMYKDPLGVKRYMSLPRNVRITGLGGKR